MRHLNCPLSTLGILAVFFLGCGKADYETAMQIQVQKLGFASNFLENLHSGRTEVIKGVASMQLPVSIDEDAKTRQKGSKNGNDGNGTPIIPQRIQPPFVQIPGFRFCYEKFVDVVTEHETEPVYCYFGSVPSSEKKQAVILAEIKRAVARKFKGAVWQDVNLDTPAGRKLPFKKMSVLGIQTFGVHQFGDDIKQLPGQFDIYVHSSSDIHVVVAFRAPEESAASTAIFQQAPFALGTLVVEGVDNVEEDG